MKRLNAIGGRASIIGEFLTFLRERKLWWMIPVVVVILLFGLVMVAAQNSPLAPFIYTLF